MTRHLIALFSRFYFLLFNIFDFVFLEEMYIIYNIVNKQTKHICIRSAMLFGIFIIIKIRYH